MAEVTVRAPAKVNLLLSVGGARPDGYHDVATVFHALSLYDEVTAAPAPDLCVSASGPRAAGVPLDPSNLAARAAVLLARRVGVAPAVHLHLHKGIPVAGGMAGGSADAAAALVACDALWGTGLPRAELLALAADLGSDVAFPLVGGTAVGRGRGEQLTSVLVGGRFDWVLAVADGGLSTPEVYAECDRLRAGRVLPEPHVPDAVLAALRSGDPTALGRALANDLQPAACSLRPGLQRTLRAASGAGALGALVSGSGPTCAVLARDAEHAVELSLALSACGTVRQVARAHGPVPGARVVDGPAA